MTLLDSLRDRVRADSRPETGSDDEVLEAPSGLDWWQAPAAGALAAAGSWLVLALPALVVWVATAHTTVGWGDALGIASAGWFLGHGASVAVGELSLSLAPLGLWLLALLLTVRGARRLLDRTERSAPGTTWPRALVRQVVPGFVLGYAAAGFLAWLLTLAGPARPGFAAVLVVLGIPVLALAWALLRRYVAGEECGVVGEWLDRLPRWLPRAVRPGVHGAAILLGLGTVLVVIMVAARWSTVSGLHAAVNAGLVGGVVLTAAQLLVLPNLAVFALGVAGRTRVPDRRRVDDHPGRRPPRPDADDPGPGGPALGRGMVRMADPPAIRAGARRRRHRVARVSQPGPTVELADQARHRPRGRRDLGRRPHRARRPRFGSGGGGSAQCRRHSATGVRGGAARPPRRGRGVVGAVGPAAAAGPPAPLTAALHGPVSGAVAAEVAAVVPA